MTKAEADAKEVELIAEYRSAERDRGYNIELGGNSKGKHSKETILKMSEAQKGKKHTEETRKKMSEAQKGEKHHMYNKHHSEETRKKMSEAQKGENNHMYNKHHSEEARKKMSEVKTGKYEGENSPVAKKVFCNGKIFTTAKECAKFYNVNYATMCNWLQGRRKVPSKFIELGLRFATEEDINTYHLYIEE